MQLLYLSINRPIVQFSSYRMGDFCLKVLGMYRVSTCCVPRYLACTDTGSTFWFSEIKNVNHLVSYHKVSVFVLLIESNVQEGEPTVPRFLLSSTFSETQEFSVSYS